MIRSLIVAGACLTMAAVSLLVPRVADSVIWDDRPAMMIWDLAPIRTKLTPGQSFDLQFRYSKRPECYPPLGRGEVEYRLWSWHEPDGYTRFRVVAQSVSFAVPSKAAHRQTTVPLPVLEPGRYGLESKAVFYCHNASKTQEVWTPIMQFDVVAGSL